MFSPVFHFHWLQWTLEMLHRLAAPRRALGVAAWLFLSLPAAQAQVAATFPGATSFPEAELRTAIAEQLLDIESKGLTQARADDAAFFLGNFYRKAGFSRVEVKYEMRGRTLVLQVKEGPRAFLRSLRFHGNRRFAEVRLAEYFAGVPVDKIAEQKIPYSEGEVSAGGDRIRGFYLSEGYLDATVDIAGTRISPDGTAADVVVNIVEGTHYTFGAVTFTGTHGHSQAELIQALGATPEGTFTPGLADTMQGSLRSWLRGRGHFNAQVAVDAPLEKARGGRVPVRFTAIPGPEFRVARIAPQGLDRVRPEFLERRFGKITGATYDPAKIDEKYRELLRTGMFRTVRIVPTEEGKDRLRLDIEVEETKQKEFGFELGYGTYDGIIAAFKLGDRNFMRTGRPLTLTLETSQRGFEGELLHIDPWFLESEWTLRARLYSLFRDEDGYSRTAAGLRFDFSRKVTSRLELSAFTEFALTDVTPEEIAPELLGPLNYRHLAVGLSQKIDMRDDPLNPRRGFIFVTSAEVGTIAGEIAFSRFTARYSHYRPLGKGMLAFGVRSGLIIPVNEVEDIPIDLRFFNGGGTTVRSFSERQLGPKAKGGQPLGGSFYTIGNIEYDFPITDVLGGAVFVDAGNLLGESEVSFGEFSYAIGVGLRYQLPIGPMRLDYGYNPSPKEGEDPGAFHFSFGFAF